MSDPASTLLSTFNAVAQIASRVLPLVNHIPDSFGKWVPPLKSVSAALEKQAASIALASSAAKALRGRFTAVDAVISGMNLRTVGATRRMSVLGSIGAYAMSKVIHHFKEGAAEARRLERETLAASQGIGKMGTAASGASPVGGFLSGGFGKIIAAVGGFRLLSSAYEHLRGVFDLGDQLNNDAAKTGILASQLVVLRQAAKDNGIDDIIGPVSHLQNELVNTLKTGVGPAADALGLLKLSAHDLVKQDQVTRLKTLAAALQQVHSPELRGSITRGLFGKQGPDLLPLLTSAGALDQAQSALGKQAGLLGVNAARFSAISTKLNYAGIKLQGFFVGLASDVLPLIEAATDRLQNLDLADMGVRFGEGIKTGVNFLAGAFSNPSVFLGAFFDLWAANSASQLNYLGNGLVFVGRQFAGSMIVGASNVAAYLAAGLQLAILKGQELFSGGFIGVVSQIATAFINAFQHVIEFFKKGMASVRATDVGGLANNAKKELLSLGLPQTGGKQDFDSLLAGWKKQFSSFAEAGEALKSTVLGQTEFFPASRLFSDAKAKAGQLTAAGAPIVNAFAGSGEPPHQKPRDPFAVFRNFATFGANALQGSSGLVGASNAGALLGSPGSGMFDFSKVADLSHSTRATNILSAGERASYANAYVGAGGQRSGSTAGAFGVVHAGDTERRRELARSQARQALQQQTDSQKQTSLLKELVDVTKDAFEG